MPRNGDAAHTFSEATLSKPKPGGGPPPCPRGHTGQVQRAGTYGRRSKEVRQLYRCIPDDQTVKPHRFADVLPRDHIHADNQDCAECRELRGIHRGETAVARRHSWSTRVVVEGLRRVADGQTYTEVSQWALRLDERVQRDLQRAEEAERRDAEKRARGVKVPPKKRRKPPKSPRPGTRWHIAADWTEAFSPVIWDNLVEKMTAEALSQHENGSLVVWVVDSTTLFGTTNAEEDDETAARTLGDRFVLLSVAEAFVSRYDESVAATQLRLVRALPNRTTQAWRLVLSEPGYAPDVVVSDADDAQLAAVVSLFPEAVVVPCHWHVRRNLEDGLAGVPGAFTGKKGEEQLDERLRRHLLELTKRSNLAEVGHIDRWWQRWEKLHVDLGLPVDRLMKQKSSYYDLMTSAADLVRAYPGLPLSVGALESIQETKLRPRFDKRASGFANIERTNRLLDLMVANARFVFDDLNAVADLLRSDARTYLGTGTPLRWVDDPHPKRAVYSSLRDPALVTDLAEQRGLA